MKRGVEEVYRKIKEVKIQGATNIAKAAVMAWRIKPGKATARKLLGARLTEPMLARVLEQLERGKKENEILEHFENAQDKINKNTIKLLRKIKARVVFTHCHSTNVVKALINAHRKGLKFSVYNTETRPLYQGRKTARELSKAGIKVKMFVDSAFDEAIGKSDIVLLGADAILKNGVINKIGSGAIAKLAWLRKKKVYVIADSWKFSKNNVEIEKRSFKEVWKNAPRKIKIMNPSFEFVDKKFIKSIVSEIGVLGFGDFAGRVAG